MQTCGVCSNNGLTMRHNTIHVQPTNQPLIQCWRRRRRRESVCEENTEMNRSVIRLFIYFLYLPFRRELLSSTRLCGKSQCDIENGRHFFPSLLFAMPQCCVVLSAVERYDIGNKLIIYHHCQVLEYFGIKTIQLRIAVHSNTMMEWIRQLTRAMLFYRWLWQWHMAQVDI